VQEGAGGGGGGGGGGEGEGESEGERGGGEGEEEGKEEEKEEGEEEVPRVGVGSSGLIDLGDLRVARGDEIRWRRSSHSRVRRHLEEKERKNEEKETEKRRGRRRRRRRKRRGRRRGRRELGKGVQIGNRREGVTVSTAAGSR